MDRCANLGQGTAGQSTCNQVSSWRLLFCPLHKLLGFTSQCVIAFHSQRVQWLQEFSFNNPRWKIQCICIQVSRRQAFWKLTPVQRTIFTFGVYRCNCPYYLQYATCKHSLGLGLLHKHFAVPPQWKGNSLEERGKRGRPRKIGHCLTRIWTMFEWKWFTIAYISFVVNVCLPPPPHVPRPLM